MSFELIERRIPPEQANEATVVIKRRKGGRCAMIVYLHSTLVKKIGWEADQPVQLMVGRDHDAGRFILLQGDVHIVARTSVGAGVGRSSLRVDLGYVETFCADGPREKAIVEVSPTADSAGLIFTLPGHANWSEEWPCDLGEDKSPDVCAIDPVKTLVPQNDLVKVVPPSNVAGPPELRSPFHQQQPKVSPPIPPTPARTRNGNRTAIADKDNILVRTNPFEIIHEGHGAIEVSELQASIIAVLVLAAPSILPETSVVKQAWPLVGRKITTGSMGMVAFEVNAMRDNLAKIGLKITNNKGIGFTIATL